MPSQHFNLLGHYLAYLTTQVTEKIQKKDTFLANKGERATGHRHLDQWPQIDSTSKHICVVTLIPLVTFEHVTMVLLPGYTMEMTCVTLGYKGTEWCTNTQCTGMSLFQLTAQRRPSRAKTLQISTLNTNLGDNLPVFM